MGWYKDRKGSWRYCTNPMHTHCFDSEGTGPSTGMAILWFIVGILSIPTIVGPIICIILCINELTKKEDPTRPKGPGTPSGWCKG